MSDKADTPLGAMRMWAGLSSQPAMLLGLGLVSGLAAWLAPPPAPSFVLAAVAGGCLAAGLMLGVWSAAARRRERLALRRAIGIVHHDPAPAFVTGATGAVLAQNAAAERRFGDRSGQSLSRAVASILPNASAVVFRTEAAVGRRPSVQETVVTPRGAVRLVALRLPGGILWRLEDGGDEARAGAGIGLPMLVASHADAVLSMNEAMYALLGRRSPGLADIFPDLPLVPGRRTRMLALNGPIEVVPIIVAARDGRREIYAVPGLAEPPAASVAARAFEALPVALLHVGAEGQVIASNRQAQSLLGIDAGERGSLSHLVEGLGRPVRDWVADALAERIPPGAEVVRARRRPDERFLQISLSRISDATGPSLLAVLHDATELKTLEQQFVQSQKMQAIGELAGGIAHDFNNLLTAITGHCDLLLLRHDQGDEDYGDLVQINQNANRAAGLVGQLLAFSRKQTLEPCVVDLRDTMGELMHLLNRLVGGKVTLTLGHDPALLPVRVDRRQLDQVIMNLVVNARDAMPEGGTVRVETRVVRLREPLRRDNAVVPQGNYVTIRVRDEGHGIPPDKLGRIFEPFFTTKKVGEGTGLGLSMVYGIVKQTGGYIFVDSVVGTGTTFTIYIPAHDTPTEAALPPPAAAALRTGEGTGPGRVLGAAAHGAGTEAAAQGSGDTDASEAAPGGEGARAIRAEGTEDDRPRPESVSSAPARATGAEAIAQAGLPGAAVPETAETAAPEQAARDAAMANEAPSGAPAREVDGHDPPDGDTGVVLLVEDEAPVRAFAARALKLRGHTVIEAEDAEAALATLRDADRRIDLFVTDVVMPGMDGPSWVREALRERPGVKVIFVSGYSEDDIAEMSHDIPGAVFLPKPFTLAELTSTVARQLH